MKKILCIFGIIAALIAGVWVAATIDEKGASAGTSILLTEETGAVTDCFRVENLLPGETARKAYKVKAGSRKVGLRLTFIEGEESGLLPYLLVKITIAGEDAFEGTLAELLSRTIEKSVSDTVSVAVEYCLPLDTENGAQGQKMDLELQFALTA